jgi:hypothetical protein
VGNEFLDRAQVKEQHLLTHGSMLLAQLVSRNATYL